MKLRTYTGLIAASAMALTLAACGKKAEEATPAADTAVTPPAGTMAATPPADAMTATPPATGSMATTPPADSMSATPPAAGSMAATPPPATEVPPATPPAK